MLGYIFRNVHYHILVENLHPYQSYSIALLHRAYLSIMIEINKLCSMSVEEIHEWVYGRH